MAEVAKRGHVTEVAGDRCGLGQTSPFPDRRETGSQETANICRRCIKVHEEPIILTASSRQNVFKHSI